MIVDGQHRKGFHQRTRWGQLKNPTLAYAMWKEAYQRGDTPWTWAQIQARYRKKMRKRRIAKLSRRTNRWKR